MNAHLDNAKLWRRAVIFAASLGVTQAILSGKRATEKQLVVILTKEFGSFGYRRFHSRLLRHAYGAGFNGIARLKEARARGWAITESIIEKGKS